MKIRMIVTPEMLQANIKCLNTESTRATNVFGRNNILTIGDLIDKLDELPKYHGMGQLSIKKIKNALVNFIIENSSDEQLRQMSFEGSGKISIEGGETVEI